MACEVLICVLGTSRGQGHVFKSDDGVGKSCLSYRFIHPGFDDFIAEHPSIIALHEFQSPAINNAHFLYWGMAKQTLPGRLGKSGRAVEIHVVENTVLYQDVTSKPFTCGSSNRADNIDSYIKRALGRLESPGKISYWTRDGISLPDLYKPQRYPSKAGSWKRGFLVVVDVSADGCEFDAQLQRVKKICLALKKNKSTYMLVATKMESAKQESLEKLNQMRKAAKLSADLICTSADCNYNISSTFRIISEKVLKDFHSQEDIPSFEQAAGADLSYKTSAKRSFKNFTTKWVHSSTEKIEDIELTEQYRACKSAVGKFETDRIFAFKLLEKRNREMMVGVNDDPERRREFLEDFIEDHPDVALYRREMAAKIEQYVSEVCEQTSDSSSSPKTPRLVHRYPLHDLSGVSNTSSTTTSPSLKDSPRKNNMTVVPSSSSSIETSSMSAGAEAAYTPTDTQSCGSFESDDDLIDYVNLAEFAENSVHSNIQPSSSDSPATEKDISPMEDPTQSEDVVPTDSLMVSCDPSSDNDSHPQSETKRSKTSTHEWVTFPQSPPTQSQVDIQNEGMMEDNQNGLCDDAVKQDDISDTGALYINHDSSYHNMGQAIQDILPPYDVVQDSLDDPLDNESNAGIEVQDDPSEDGSSVTKETISETHSKDDVTSSPQSTPHIPSKEEDLHMSSSLLPASSPSESVNKQQLAVATKPKPPLPPHKPKHRSSTQSAVKVYPENFSIKKELVPAATNTVPSSPVKPPSPLSTSSLTTPTTRSEEITAINEEVKFVIRNDELSPDEPPAVPKRSKDYHIVVLNKDSKSTIKEKKESSSNKKETREQVSPLSTSSLTTPTTRSEDLTEEVKFVIRNDEPPAVPKRGKDYNIVVLNKDSKSTIKESSSNKKETREQVSPSHTSEKENTGKKKKKKFYENFTLKKGGNKRSPSPTSPEITVQNVVSEKDKQKQTKSKHSPSPEKSKKKLKYSKSDCKAPEGTKQHIFKRAPIEVPRPTPKMSNTLPRATFLNMRKRPLPEMPYTLPPDDYDDDDDDNKEYTLVDTMLPNQSSHSPWPRAHLPLYQHYHSQQQRPLPPMQYGNGSMSDYVNEDEFPRPIPTSHSLQIGSTISSTDPYPFPTSSVHDRPPLAPPSMYSSSPQSLQQLEHHRPITIQQPHPALVSHHSFDQHHPLSRASSNPPESNTLPSPDYSYPKIPGLLFMRAMPHTSLQMSRSIDFELEDQYVEMAPRQTDETYQNIDAIKATRSHSMEDLHLYKNFPASSSSSLGQTSVFDRTMPLPPRGTQSNTAPSNTPPSQEHTPFPVRSILPNVTQPTATPSKIITIPPRNLLRQTSSLERESNSASQSVDILHLTDNATSFSNHQIIPPHSQLQTGSPQLSPRPVPKPRRDLSAQNTLDLSSRQISQASSQASSHQQPSTTSSSQAQCELPPHLEYMPKFSKPVRTPKPSTQRTVGTSSWTTKDDLNYYNVVSKSFLSPPKPPPPPPSYLDILPDKVNIGQND